MRGGGLGRDVRGESEQGVHEVLVYFEDVDGVRRCSGAGILSFQWPLEAAVVG